MKKYVTALILSILILTHTTFATPIWIDVRSPEMHKATGIQGDLNIPIDQLLETLRNSSSITKGKNTEIKLYCGQGMLASMAEEKLREAGYTNVENVGGFNDAKKRRNIE